MKKKERAPEPATPEQDVRNAEQDDALDKAGPAAEESEEAAACEEQPDPEEIMRLAVEALTDRLQRTMAEFDNYRKRTLREKTSAYDNGAGDTAEKFLPVVDNFERAIMASEDKETPMYKGLYMIYRQLCGVLDEIGVTALPGAGEKFDPNLHHAVSHVEDESYGEGVVVEELQKGYKFRDRVIRPGMVKVAN